MTRTRTSRRVCKVGMAADNPYCWNKACGTVLASHLGKSPAAIRGDTRNLPFEDATFNHVISIDRQHHSGDIARAVREIHRVLRPGGSAVVMIYNALCYKNWIVALRETVPTLASQAQRLEFDRVSAAASVLSEDAGIRIAYPGALVWPEPVHHS